MEERTRYVAMNHKGCYVTATTQDCDIYKAITFGTREECRTFLEKRFVWANEYQIKEIQVKIT